MSSRVEVKADSEILDEMIKNLQTTDATMKVGVLEGATKTPEPWDKERPVYIAKYAAKNEFGDVGVPPRPFLRNTVREHRNEWISQLKLMVQKNNFDIMTSLQGYKEIPVGHVMETIKSGVPPKSSQKTIALKKERRRPITDVPLIDSGYLLSSISAEVVKK